MNKSVKVVIKVNWLKEPEDISMIEHSFGKSLYRQRNPKARKVVTFKPELRGRKNRR